MNSTLDWYRSWVRRYVGDLLDDYSKGLDRGVPKAASEKEFNDAVWKTIVLYPCELIILDSPLLQRLRNIRQLGVAHWIYPSAVHTRFEHSIGAVHMIQRMTESLRRSRNVPSPQLQLDDKWVHLLRIAALLHDIGHGLMSHVSENALRGMGYEERLRLEAEERLGLQCSFSELTAYLMIDSPSLRKLIDRALLISKHPMPQDAADLIRDAIIGRRINPRFPLLQELITGPYDADKLDYMTRDAHSTGIPTVTDIPRLIQKIRFTEVSKEEVPDSIAGMVTSIHPSFVINSIASSGARTLDELVLGRILLFDKVYRHQKVRAAEAMVANVFAILEEGIGRDILTLPLALDDNALLSRDNWALRAFLGSQGKPTRGGRLRSVEYLCRRLRDRDIFVRAYAFAKHMPRDPFANDTAQRVGLDSLLRVMEQPPSRRSIKQAVLVELRRMRHLGALKLTGAVAGMQVSALIALDPPSRSVPGRQISRALIETSRKGLVPFNPASEPWSNAYLLTRDLGYVFCDRQIAPHVFLATEAVVRRRFGIRTPEGVHDYVKLGSDDVEVLRKRLTLKGYYKQRAPDLRSPPDYLKKLQAERDIGRIVQNMRGFDGLESRKGTDGPSTMRVSEARVLAFVRQFSSEEDVEDIVELSRAIKVIARADCHAALNAFLGKHPEFRDAYVCPLGSPNDSSAILSYYAQDVNGAGIDLKAMSLHDARETSPKKAILFIDDYAGSGRQAKTILQQLLGDRDRDTLGEEHVHALDLERRRQFVERRLGYVFVCGKPAGVSSLLAGVAAGKHGLKLDVHVHARDDDIPRAFDGDTIHFASDARRVRFRKRCQSIGRQLLRGYGGRNRTPAWIEERALGYGNDALLIAFPYNVPTASLALLWCEGKVDGQPWLPLLPRRKKD